MQDSKPHCIKCNRFFVYLSQYLTNFMHKICFTMSLISCPYMFRALLCSSSEGQNCITQPLVCLHLSIFISVFNQLHAQNLFHNEFNFMPLHVSSTVVLIIRRSKLHYTASGIITLKQMSGLKLLKYNSINRSK